MRRALHYSSAADLHVGTSTLQQNHNSDYKMFGPSPGSITHWCMRALPIGTDTIPKGFVAT